MILLHEPKCYSHVVLLVFHDATEIFDVLLKTFT
jgi:hypothetical protein